MSESARPSMVRTLRRRILIVVAVAGIVLAIASVWGVGLITLRTAETQVRVTAQTVTTWPQLQRGGLIIDDAQLRAANVGSTVVALLDADGQLVAASADTAIPFADLEDVAGAVHGDETARAEIAGRSALFTRVDLPPGTVYDDGTATPVSTALVGVGMEAADRLVTALALAALAVLAVVLALAGVVVTLVVSRTTRSLTVLADRVEQSHLTDLAASPAGEFGETESVARAIERLDGRRDATERRLRTFVADASHELRTPLTKIQGWTQLHFQRPDDAETTERAFGSVSEESERMGVLVDRLALLARSEATSPVRERVDLREVCRAAVEDAALLAPDAAVAVITDRPVVIDGDPHAIAQLVRNLVGNALRHAGPHASITIDVREEGETAVLVVADDGVGMAPDLRDRAFERFVSGDRRAGSGLGLAIVEAIAVAHGGVVALESEPGAGTRVTVRLPSAASR
ncbi:sensor histidine kinase [Microbacterium testaceum]|uniref:sensor histidine kinase n=1 Tax=Microbacterium testaceum TaxID=2033 RepID=UPI001D174DD7|nr:HAMP domain-containing sensor histidine kinase [Microbacterium testaceum]MCC4249790.1 HAMP domain-containing histidine kinase [Microbacterium testaceum]